MDKRAIRINNSKGINDQISLIWDDNVIIRAQDLEDGTDYTYTEVVKPFVIKEILKLTTKESKILDIGCGCGFLTNAIYVKNRHLITGIDISQESIVYSKKRYPEIEFQHQNICFLSNQNQYDFCLAVMTLNNLSDIETFFSVTHKILNPNGKLLIIIPHPCFWPLRHVESTSFIYSEVQCYKISFSTKGRHDYLSKILYFHRPIEFYINSIKKAGFYIENIRELNEAEHEKVPEILSFILTKQN